MSYLIDVRTFSKIVKNNILFSGLTFPFFRLHTQVGGTFELKDENHTVIGVAPLKDLFHLPKTLLVDDTYDQLLRGQTSQSVQGK